MINLITNNTDQVNNNYQSNNNLQLENTESQNTELQYVEYSNTDIFENNDPNNVNSSYILQNAPIYTEIVNDENSNIFNTYVIDIDVNSINNTSDPNKVVRTTTPVPTNTDDK